MSRIDFYGSLRTGDYTVIVSIFEKWVKKNNLDVKLRLSGEEIVNENEDLYFYCYNAVSSEEIEPSFLLEGYMVGTLDEAKLMLHALVKLCTDYHIASNFEYVEVNEDGDEVSEEFRVCTNK